MSGLVWVGIGLLGGTGAVARSVVGAAVARWTARSGFPFGTLAVNLSGSFVLGVLAGSTLHDDALVLAGGALIGSYTTFSTWMYESSRLPRRLAAANVGASLVLGLGAVALGRALGGL